MTIIQAADHATGFPPPEQRLFRLTEKVSNPADEILRYEAVIENSRKHAAHQRITANQTISATHFDLTGELAGRIPKTADLAKQVAAMATSKW